MIMNTYIDTYVNFLVADAIMTSGPLDGQFAMLDGPGGLGPPPPPGPQSGTFPRGSKKNQCKLPTQTLIIDIFLDSLAQTVVFL